MAKRNEQEQSAQAAATPTKREQWLQNMRNKYPDVQDEDELYGRSMEGYDTEHDYAKNQRAENQELNDLITSNPHLANFYSEMFERGKDGHPEMALLNLGDLLNAYVTGEMSSDEYIAEKEKREKAESQQNEIYLAWCEKKGYDPKEWSKRASEMLFTPMSKYELAEAQFDAIDKMLNYDDDIEAARVQERNGKIVTERRKNANATDGMVNKNSAAAAQPQQKTKRSIFDVAREAE